MTAAPEKTHVVKEYSHKSPLITCRFDARGRFVFAGAEDRTVRRWDLATGKEAALAGHESWVFSLASHPGGETIVSGGGDGQLIWWPVTADKPAPIRRIQAHRGLGARPGVQPGRVDCRLVRQRPDGPPLVVRRWFTPSRAAGPRAACLSGLVQSERSHVNLGRPERRGDRMGPSPGQGGSTARRGQALQAQCGRAGGRLRRRARPVAERRRQVSRMWRPDRSQ